MKKKRIVISTTLIIFFTIIIYMASKYIYYYIQEDAYYSSSFTDYNSEKKYVMIAPINRVLKEIKYPIFIDTTLLNIKFTLPFNIQRDSVQLIYQDRALVGGTIKDNRQDKGILFHLTNDSVTEDLRNELLSIDNKLNIELNYSVYEKIYSHIPKMNLLYDSYDEIKYNLRLTKLKAASLPNGGDKYIYKFNNSKYNGFQFCNPDTCKTVMISLFKNSEEWTFIFKNFTQDEIDFVLTSLEWDDKSG